MLIKLGRQFFCAGLYIAVILGLTGACGPEHYKAEADKECRVASPRVDKCFKSMVKTKPNNIIATASSRATTAITVSVNGPRERYSLITAMVAAGSVAVAMAAKGRAAASGIFKRYKANKQRKNAPRAWRTVITATLKPSFLIKLKLNPAPMIKAIIPRAI